MHAPIIDAAPLLAAALRRSAAAAGVALDVVTVEERPWASLTFSGTRHRLMLAADADSAFDAWLAGIESANLPVRGHVAGEPVLVGRQHVGGRLHATLDALTIEDG